MFTSPRILILGIMWVSFDRRQLKAGPDSEDELPTLGLTDKTRD